jgi:hypothetical protein
MELKASLLAILLGGILSAFGTLQQAWSVIEPIAWLVVVATSIATYAQVKVRKSKAYSTSKKEVVVALQIGRPVSEAVKAHFGALDCLIDIEVVLGKGTLESSRDYKMLAQSVYRAMASHQSAKINLVLSGPVGLNCLIGQLIGLHHFNVVVYQFNPKAAGYQELPVPDRTWL